MSIKDTYDWAKQQRAGWDKMVKEKHPMVTRLDTELSSGGDHPIAVLAFYRTDRSSFVGEVGKNDDGDLVFHFWPTANDTYHSLVDIRGEPTWVFGDSFEQALAQSFIDVFKLEEKLCWDFVPEMNSWVVRAQGFGNNVMAERIAARLFDKLQDRLEK